MTNAMRDVLENPAASYWLKDAIKALANRDIVDAVQDAEILVRLFSEALAGDRT